MKRRYPKVTIYAVFDTAFHSTIPHKAGLYAIPFELTQKHKIRRYGFHGISHRYLMERMRRSWAERAELKRAFEHHLKETKGQIVRLEKAFKILGKSPKSKPCEGMKGILIEGSEMLHQTAFGDIRDVALISAAQRVEHYEMAAYGTVRTYAENLDQQKLFSCSRKPWKKRKQLTRN